MNYTEINTIIHCYSKVRKNIKKIVILIILLSTNGNFFTYSQAYTVYEAGGFKNQNIDKTSTSNNYSVSYYTGTPIIKIPIYEIKANKIKIPVALNYNTDIVKPNNHPGATGLGWSLDCGGSITRRINGRCDDWGSAGYLNNEQRLSDNLDQAKKDMSLSSLNDMFNGKWSDENTMYQYAFSESTGYDCSPDEFSFNFLGFSGKFFRSHNGEWQVISSTNFSIKHNLISYSKTRPLINLNKTFDTSFKSIDQFELTGPDGTIYIFGGENAIDFCFNFFYQNREIPKATTWHLSEIKHPKSNSIKFKYLIAPPQLEGDMNFHLQTNFAHFGYAGVNFNVYLPVHLQSVSINDKDILTFSYQKSIQEKFPEKYIFYPSDNFFISIDMLNLPPYSVKTPLASFRDCEWLELDKIELPNGVNYKFKYNNLLNERLKLESIEMLDSHLNSGGSYVFTYNNKRFPPYLSGHYDHLGFYNGKDFSFLYSCDFYLREKTSSDLKEKSLSYLNARAGDKSGEFINAEMIESIKYPDGGKTDFEFEPNYISGTVYYDETTDFKLIPSVISNPMYPGGLRIKKITNYLGNNVFSSSKRYYYIKNYTPNSTTTISSGVLSFTPNYFYDLILLNLHADLSSGFWMRDVQIFTSNTGYNESNNYVGYSEVVESNEDKYGNTLSYTKYTFTNFEKDIWGNSHFDEPAITRLNTEWLKSDGKVLKRSLTPVISIDGKTSSYKYLRRSLSPATPFSSKQMERGKIVSEIYFNENYGKIKSINYKYSLSSVDYVRRLYLFITPVAEYVNTTPFSNSDPSQVPNYTPSMFNIFALGGAFKEYTGNYELTEKEEKLYNSTTSVSSKTFYKYSNKLLSQEKIITSKNDTLTTDYLYPLNLPYNAISVVLENYAYAGMVNDGVIEQPIEITKKKNNKVIESTLNKYKIIDNWPTLVSEFTTSSQSLIENFKTYNGIMDNHYCRESEVTYLYDSHLNITQKTFKNGLSIAYIWGYNFQYPIAEIINATYKDITEYLNTLGLTDIENDISKKESPDMNKINMLRNGLKNAFVTTYTFIPWIGVKTKTDYRGITTYYDYDSFNRLHSIKDNNEKIIHAIDYNHQH